MHIKPQMPFECTHLRFSFQTAPCMVRAAIEERTPVDRKPSSKIHECYSLLVCELRVVWLTQVAQNAYRSETKIVRNGPTQRQMY